MNPEPAGGHTPLSLYTAVVSCVAIITLGAVRIVGITHGLDAELSLTVDIVIAAIAGVSTTRLLLRKGA